MKSKVSSFFASILSIGRGPLQQTGLLFQYAEGSWIENLAVRQDGSLLFTSLGTPGGLHSFDPFHGNAEPTLIASFPSFNSTVGIVETTPDNFYFLTANFTLEGGTQPGSNAIFRLDFDDGVSTPQVEKLADVKGAGELNGLTAFNDTVLLSADSYLGAVWAVDTRSGSAFVVAQDPLMAPGEAMDAFKLGINGLHYREGILYFTNTNQALLGKLHLDQNVRPISPATVIARSEVEAGVHTTWDDFTIGPNGNIFVATPGANAIQMVTLDGRVHTLAGSVNSTTLAQPTSAKFGRSRWDSDALYVTTAGGLGEPVFENDKAVTVGAQIVAVHFDQHHSSFWRMS